jgi:hypothetical protein
MSSSYPIDKVDLTCSVNGRSLLELTGTVCIVEDIHSTWPRSSIHIANDPRHETQYFKAGDQISINVTPQSGTALKVGHVVHNSNMKLKPAGRAHAGVISGVSPDLEKAVTERFTKGYGSGGQNIDKHAQDIHKEVLKSKFPLETGEGMKKASAVYSTLMPTEALKKAGRLTGTGAPAFYYQTNENGGKAHFKTLNDLTKKGPKRTFKVNSTAASNPNSLYDATTVYDHEYNSSPITTKKQTEAQAKTYVPEYGKTANTQKSGQGLSSPGLGVNSAEAKAAMPITNTKEQQDQKRYEDATQQDLNPYTATLKLLVAIATDLHAGDIIQFDSGSSTYFDDASPNNSASGKWMIASLMHTIETGGKSGTPYHTGRTLLHCVGPIK